MVKNGSLAKLLCDKGSRKKNGPKKTMDRGKIIAYSPNGKVSDAILDLNIGI
jgi:hypothetical protein